MMMTVGFFVGKHKYIYIMVIGLTLLNPGSIITVAMNIMFSLYMSSKILHYILNNSLAYHKLSLTIYKKIYGDEHLNVAACSNKIGNFVSDLGKHQEALSYYEQSLAMRKKVYGDEHTNVTVADSLNNIGEVLSKLGKHQEALSYHEQSLAIGKKIIPF